MKQNARKKIVTFGEILQRLSPPDNEHIESAKNFNVFYGGSEFNTISFLANLGYDCCYISVLPDNQLGHGVEKFLQKQNINTSFIKFTGDTLGLYYFEKTFGSLSANVIYNRKNSEIAKINPTEINLDYDAIFKNCDIFHISGISFALSDNCKTICFTLLEEAKKRHVKISFDFNYRSKLWSIKDAAEVYKKSFLM